MSKRPHYEGDPTLARVMVRPQWILALLLSLAVAAAFAGLAQWQMGSAIKLEETVIDSETVYPMPELTGPGTPVNEEVAGRMTELEMRLVPGDSIVVENRMNQDERGFWVVSHFTNAAEDEHLTVALGWADTRERAEAALEVADTDETLLDLHQVTGRYMPSEGVDQPAPGTPLDTYTSLGTGLIINLWSPWQGTAYAGYLVNDTPSADLDKIDSFPPLPEEKINWLNLFYALEWLVFAGFAVFFWYRLARDAWEKEHEMKELLAESSGASTVE